MSLSTKEYVLECNLCNDADDRVRRLKHVQSTFQAYLDCESAAIEQARRDEGVNKGVRAELKKESALRRQAELKLQNLEQAREREAALLKATKDEKVSLEVRLQEALAESTHRRDCMEDLVATSHTLKSEVDRCQQECKRLSANNDVNAANAREESLLADNASLQRQLGYWRTCSESLSFQVQQVEALGFTINRNPYQQGPLAPPSWGPPSYPNQYPGHSPRMASTMPSAPMDNAYEATGTAASTPPTMPSAPVSNAHETTAAVTSAASLPLHSTPAPEGPTETVEPVAEPAPVVDCHAFLIKLQQKDSAAGGQIAVTDPSPTHSTVPALHGEPSFSTFVPTAPVQASRAGVADNQTCLPAERTAKVSRTTGITFAPSPPAMKPARPVYVPAMPAEFFAAVSKTGLKDYRKAVQAPEEGIRNPKNGAAPSGPQWVIPPPSHCPQIQNSTSPEQGEDCQQDMAGEHSGQSKSACEPVEQSMGHPQSNDRHPGNAQQEMGINVGRGNHMTQLGRQALMDKVRQRKGETKGQTATSTTISESHLL